MTHRPMSVATAALAVSVALGAACRGDRGAGGLREMSADERRAAGSLLLANPATVAPLTTPKGPGRIIYDAPVDLSLANAQRTRPDLVRADTTPRDTSTATRRDTTGGDATADTSGGAARRRRP